ncbi:MAG: PEP-CTERM sorting domain-containing protein [Phycisphaerae bacterium]|jgi:hypothetical protein
MAHRSRFARHGLHLGLATVACLIIAIPAAPAAFIHFDPATPIAIPPSTDTGYYMNVTNGDFGPMGTVENPSIGWYTTMSGVLPMLHFGVPTGSGSGYQGALLNSPLNLAPGTYIGPDSAFYNGTGLGAAFHQTGTEIAGFRFINHDTNVYNYGWIRVTTTSGGGYPAAILDWGYDDTGAPVFAGLVPEPGTAASFVLVGALCLMRRR